MRTFCAVVLIVGLAIPAHAQESRGWSFSGSFNGSSNADGIVTKAEPVLGYKFNKHFSTYTGIPFYFVNPSSSSVMSGIGNAFLGFRVGTETDSVNYSSNLEFTAPTGDKTRGFSTGRVTVDWTNRISHRFGSVTPFGSAGIANTVSDTAFFIRPFTSLGVVGHFEGGATVDASRFFWIGGSAYAVRGSGQQRVISKVIERQISSANTAAASSRGRGNSGQKALVFETQTETVSQAELVNDHGVSTWFGVSPKPGVDFHAGYSRSVNYDFNTLFFGVGFHVGK